MYAKFQYKKIYTTATMMSQSHYDSSRQLILLHSNYHKFYILTWNWVCNSFLKKLTIQCTINLKLNPIDFTHKDLWSLKVTVPNYGEGLPIREYFLTQSSVTVPYKLVFELKIALFGKLIKKSSYIPNLTISIFIHRILHKIEVIALENTRQQNLSLFKPTPRFPHSSNWSVW